MRMKEQAKEAARRRIERRSQDETQQAERIRLCMKGIIAQNFDPHWTKATNILHMQSNSLKAIMKGKSC
jgi:hypothetical protein